MPAEQAENKAVTARKAPWKGNAKRRLKFWTNVCLTAAVAAGVIMAIAHGGNVTTAVAWGGAALGSGALLGFLFGVPGRSTRKVVINQPGLAAVDTGINRASGIAGSGVTTVPESGTGPNAVPVPDVEGSPPAGQATATAPPDADSDAAKSPAAPIPAVNDQGTEDSNLVQVSDWVTKLLLGGGLTQLQQIPPRIWELAGWVAIGIDPGAAARGKEAILQSNQAFAAGLLIYFSVLGFFGGYFITQLQFRKRLQP